MYYRPTKEKLEENTFETLWMIVNLFSGSKNASRPSVLYIMA
jgi:hypothetical protein